MPNNVPSMPTNVPLVGQPVKILGYTVLALAQCQCGTSTPMQLVAQLAQDGPHSAPAVCLACNRVYTIQQIVTDDAGNLLFSMSIQDAPTLQ